MTNTDLVLTDRAAVALLDDIEQRLAEVDTPEDADRLWREVQAVEEAARLARLADASVAAFTRARLRARRRHGELLGPAETGRPKKVSARNDLPAAAEDRVQQHRARKLAAIPADVFEAAVAGDDPEKAPSEASVLRAGRVAARTAAPPEPVPMPEGVFSVLLADPPWRYDAPGGSSPDDRSVDNHYPSMDTEEIAGLKVPAAEDAVLFLWATNPKLREALAVMEAWGFEYRTNAVWVKDRIGMGYYVRGQHELLLIGRRGSLPTPAPGDRPPSVIAAPRGAHSEKPAAAHEMIEAMYPNQRRVELFARRAREGWTGWGQQV